MNCDTLFSDEPTTSPQRGAIISACGTSRYRLWRVWGPGPQVAFVMLNPSTADAQLDDPTIRRCTGFAKAWDYDGFQVVNLFGYRATDPKAVRGVADPVGPDNDPHIIEVTESAALTVCAWGRNPTFGRDQQVLNLLHAQGVTPHAIRILDGGVPAHPLMLPKGLQPMLLDTTGSEAIR